MSNYFFKSHQKTSDKNEETGRRKSYELKNGKLKKKKEKKFYVTRFLKDGLSIFLNFLFLTAKVSFLMGYFMKTRKCTTLLSVNFFQCQKPHYPLV